MPKGRKSRSSSGSYLCEQQGLGNPALPEPRTTHARGAGHTGGGESLLPSCPSGDGSQGPALGNKGPHVGGRGGEGGKGGYRARLARTPPTRPERNETGGSSDTEGRGSQQRTGPRGAPSGPASGLPRAPGWQRHLPTPGETDGPANACQAKGFAPATSLREALGGPQTAGPARAPRQPFALGHSKICMTMAWGRVGVGLGLGNLTLYNQGRGKAILHSIPFLSGASLSLGAFSRVPKCQFPDWLLGGCHSKQRMQP